MAGGRQNLCVCVCVCVCAHLLDLAPLFTAHCWRETEPVCMCVCVCSCMRAHLLDLAPLCTTHGWREAEPADTTPCSDAARLDELIFQLTALQLSKHRNGYLELRRETFEDECNSIDFPYCIQMKIYKLLAVYYLILLNYYNFKKFIFHTVFGKNYEKNMTFSQTHKN